MKKILFIILFLLLFFSCSNIISTPDVKSNYYTVKISVETEHIGAIPSFENSNNSNFSKSAYGSVDTSGLQTIVYYKKSTAASYTELTSPFDPSQMFELKLTSGEWDLKAESFKKNDAKKIVLYQSEPVKVILNDDTLDQTIKLTQVAQPDQNGKGTVNLKINLSSAVTSKIKKCTAKWHKRGAGINPNDTQDITVSNSISYFTMNSTSESPIDSAVYDVDFYFKNNSDNILYRCSEVIVVYNDLCTDTWEDSGNSEHFANQTSGGKNYLVLCVDDNCVSSQAVGDTIYVNPDAADGGNGSFFGEFKTLKAAVDAVNANSSITTICVQENKEYTIDSTITFSKNVVLKTYNKSAPRYGYTSTLKRGSLCTGSMFTVSSGKSVTFEGEFVIDGNNSATSADGAGINNNGSLTLKNTEIKKCKTSGMGAGIYNNGTLTFDTGAKVTGCDVYLVDTKIITLANGATSFSAIITPNDYDAQYALLKSDSLNLSKIAKFDVTAKVAGGVTTKYYLDTNAKLIAETIPVSVLAEKISGVPTSANYPELLVESVQDFSKIITWSKSTSFSGITIVQKDDLDISGVSNFVGIGSSTYPFKGNYDGNGKDITVNINVSSNPSAVGIGLFTNTENATIENVNVEGTISCTYSSGSTFGIGGIVGYAKEGTAIQNCTNNAKVEATATYNYAGGIVGVIQTGCSIDYCFNTKEIQGFKYAGGIVGWLDIETGNNIQIWNCGNSGKVTSEYNAGGIISQANRTDIINCYNVGDIEVTSGDAGAQVGSIAGNLGSLGGSFKNCCSYANLNRNNSKTNCGGFAYGSPGTVFTFDNCYYWAGDSSDYSAFGNLTTDENVLSFEKQGSEGKISGSDLVILLNNFVNGNSNYYKWKYDNTLFINLSNVKGL